MVQGVDISFLNEQEQQWVLDAMFDMNIFPNTQQSARLKAFMRRTSYLTVFVKTQSGIILIRHHGDAL